MKTLMKHFLVTNGMLQQSLLSNHGKSIKGSVAEIVEGLSLYSELSKEDLYPSSYLFATSLSIYKINFENFIVY